MIKVWVLAMVLPIWLRLISSEIFRSPDTSETSRKWCQSCSHFYFIGSWLQ